MRACAAAKGANREEHLVRHWPGCGPREAAPAAVSLASPDTRVGNTKAKQRKSKNKQRAVAPFLCLLLALHLRRPAVPHEGECGAHSAAHALT